MRQLTILVLIMVLITTGCTARYSKTLVGSISIEQYQPRMSQSTGFEIYNIVTNEPASARDISLNLSCESTLTQVDYRSTFFYAFLLFSMPKVNLYWHLILSHLDKFYIIK